MKKKVKVISGVITVCLLVLFSWDYQMRTTWDDHVVVELVSYSLNRGNEHSWDRLDRWDRLNKDEVKRLSEKHDIPKTLEILKNNEGYIWVSNEDKAVKKTVVGEARKYNIYSTKDENEYVKIQFNLFEWGGCDARTSVWTGNARMYTTLDNGDVLAAAGHVYPYENIFQYFLCPEVRADSQSLINILSHYL